MDAVQHNDSRAVARCRSVECQQDYKQATAMHESEELLTSSASEHRQETKGTRVKIPGVNITEFAESIISVEVLGEKAKQSRLGGVKQSSLGGDGQASKSWRRDPSNGRKSQVIKS